MNRTLKEATVRRYHYETHQQLREHLEAFLNAYNFAKRLKTLRGLTPYEHICKAWADQPRRPSIIFCGGIGAFPPPSRARYVRWIATGVPPAPFVTSATIVGQIPPEGCFRPA